jgi:hypothetical protein
MFDRLKKWLHAWKSGEKEVLDGEKEVKEALDGEKEVLVREHIRRKPQKASEEIKSLAINTTKEFLIYIDRDGAMAEIADARIAEASREFRSEQEAKGEASRQQMEEIYRRLTEVDNAVKELRTATVDGADHIEELNHRLATHEASAAAVVEGINTRLAGLQEEIAKETADRHGAISHLHAALTEKISATHVEQMFQKLQAESAAKDRDALLKEEVNDRRLREVEAGTQDIRAEVARDVERIGELRHDVDAQLKAFRERLGRDIEVRMPAFTMRLEDGDDEVIPVEPVVPDVSQVGATD